MPAPIYTTTNNIFYVYGYRDPLSKIFYYIGKGSNGRAYGNHGKRIPVPKNKKDDIIFFIRDLSENTAFYIEKFFIKCYGRKDNETGNLLNRTNGGGKGPFGAKRSEETLKNMSIGQLNRKEEYPEKRSESAKRSWTSEERHIQASNIAKERWKRERLEKLQYNLDHPEEAIKCIKIEKDAMVEYQRSWYQRNKERCKIRQKERYHRLKQHQEK